MSLNSRMQPLPQVATSNPLLFNIVWGGGGLEYYTKNGFAKSNPVFNNVLNTFVPNCIFKLNLDHSLFEEHGQLTF